jgi:cytochrome oxidase Cu insertion factor (SCO1/SenC/PrrC family)
MVLIVVLPATVVTSNSATNNGPLYGYSVGSKAIDFTLNDLSVNPITLSSLLGKPVLLGFWDTA